MWAEPAVTTPPAHVRRDQALAAIVLVAGAVEALTRPGSGWPPVALALAFALALATLVRRTHGLAAVALAFGAFVVVDVAAAVLGAEPVVLFSGAVVLVLVYSLCRWGAGRDVVLGLGVVAARVHGQRRHRLHGAGRHRSAERPCCCSPPHWVWRSGTGP